MQNQTPSGATSGYTPYPQQQPQQPQQYAPQQQPQWQQYQQPQYQQPTCQAPQQYQPLYQESKPEPKLKRDKVLLVSAIFAVVWFIIVCSGFADLMNATPTGTEAEQLGYEIGAAIGMMTQIPFLIVAFIGIVFNWLSWFMSKRGFAITAGVLFSVSVLLSIGNGFAYILCLVLCFVGASRLKKRMA